MITREVLNADEMSLPIMVEGANTVGIGISGTWTGTVYFEKALKDNPTVWIGASATPFASGTAVASATANGNWFITVEANIFAVRVRFDRTTGSVTAILSAANDSSWQDAFLSATTVHVSSTVSSGTNTLTQTAQANRAWNCQFCDVSFAGVSFAGGAGRVSFYDGTVAGSLLYEEFLKTPDVAGSVGWVQKMELPPGGLTTTPGNAMTIVVRGLNNTTSIINAKFSAA